VPAIRHFVIRDFVLSLSALSFPHSQTPIAAKACAAIQPRPLGHRQILPLADASIARRAITRIEAHQHD